MPKSIRTRCVDLVEQFPDRFSTEFDKNKHVLKEMDLPFSKVEVNLMAGCLSRMKTKEKKAA